MSIDLVPLSQLPSRYGIARSNLYNRIKELKIESVKHGRKAFVTKAHLELLDGLHAHLERGGTIFGFIQLLKKQGHQHGDWTSCFLKDTAPHIRSSVPRHQLTHVSTVDPSISYSVDRADYIEPTISLNPAALVSVIETVVKKLVPQSTNRLTYLKELEDAYQNGWLLSTSEVSDLLGLSPKTIANYGTEFNDAGFCFTRAGTRKGGEIAWSIDKQSDWTESAPSSTKDVKAAFSDVFDP